MNSTKNLPQKPSQDPASFTSWGVLAGIVLGIIVSLFAGHLLAWTGTLTFVGWIAGALIDRSRLS